MVKHQDGGTEVTINGIGCQGAVIVNGRQVTLFFFVCVKKSFDVCLFVCFCDNVSAQVGIVSQAAIMQSTLMITSLCMLMAQCVAFQVRLSHLTTIYLSNTMETSGPPNSFDANAVHRFVYDVESGLIYTVGMCE